MLADDKATEEVVLGDEGVSKGLVAGAVHVSCSTISVELSKRLDSAHRVLGQGYVAAPVFGRPDAAAAKQLWVVVAASALRRGPLPRLSLSALGRGVTRLGEDPPAANVVKLAGNFILASMIESLAEAFTLARKSASRPPSSWRCSAPSWSAPPSSSATPASSPRRRSPPPASRCTSASRTWAWSSPPAPPRRGPPAALKRSSATTCSRRVASSRAGGDLDWSAPAPPSPPSARGWWRVRPLTRERLVGPVHSAVIPASRKSAADGLPRALWAMRSLSLSSLTRSSCRAIRPW